MRLSSRSLSEHGDGSPQAQVWCMSWLADADKKKLSSSMLLISSLSTIGSQAFVFSNLLWMADESWQTYSK